MRTAPVSGLLAPVALLLLLWPSDRVTDACSCSPVHPQQAFCNADIVTFRNPAVASMLQAHVTGLQDVMDLEAAMRIDIYSAAQVGFRKWISTVEDLRYITEMIRAKAIVGKEVDSGNDVYGNPIKRIQYEIKQIKMFKGPTEDIQYIFTAPSSAVCGVTLETGGKKEYLIAGKAEGNGKMHITLCDFIVPWDSLTQTQKKSLNQRYEMGCECKISRCPSIPCYVSSQDECLWTDWMTEKSINGRQAKHYACIKRSDGSCSWYRGTAPPKQEFLDIEDP